MNLGAAYSSATSVSEFDVLKTELVKIGDTYDDAADAARADVLQSGAAWIPPFDDPRTAAGPGTCTAGCWRRSTAS